MVIDNQRKTYYTRTKKAKLDAYFLGMNGDNPIENVGKYIISITSHLFVFCPCLNWNPSGLMRTLLLYYQMVVGGIFPPHQAEMVGREGLTTSPRLRNV